MFKYTPTLRVAITKDELRPEFNGDLVAAQKAFFEYYASLDVSKEPIFKAKAVELLDEGGVETDILLEDFEAVIVAKFRNNVILSTGDVVALKWKVIY